MDEQRDYFISYNSADADHAAAINTALRAAGYSTHFAGTDLPHGANIAVWMDQGLFSSVQVLALCSPDYFKPEAEYSEAERAATFWADPVGAQAKLIPVEIAPCDYRPLYAPLKRITETSGKLPEAAAAALLAALQTAERTQEREAQRIAARTPPVFEVPRARLGHFFGRDQALAELHQTLAQGQAAAVTQVVGGMGGVGKTTLAAEYAHRFGTAGRYAGVWWVGADSESGLIDSLGRLAERLGMPEEADRPKMARAALAHVSAGRDAHGDATSLPWLLIYDNVPNPEGLFAHGPDGTRAHPWLPAGAARVLITSRW